MDNIMQAYHEKTQTCLRCALCQTVCPIFRELHGELASPRSKVRLIQELLEGRLKFSARLEELLHLCIGCKRCEENCPAKIDIHNLILTARAEFVKNKGYSLSKKIMLRQILGPRSSGLHWLFRSLAVYQKTFPGRLISSSGLPNLMMENAREKEVLLAPVPSRTFFQQPELKQKSAAGDRPKVGYFVGCLTNHLFPSQAEAVVKVLQYSGYDVEIPRDVGCCGLPQRSAGDVEEAKKLALRNIKAFQSDIIVTDCASCSSFLKEYENLYAGTPEAESFKHFSEKVYDISYFLSRESLSVIKGGSQISVTYHDPCHLIRGQNISREPRKLLQNIPGLKLVEMEGADECCGGGGLFSLTHFRLSRMILKRKLDNIAATGAEIVATSCPACRMQLQSGFTAEKIPQKVVHPVELLARFLEI